MGTLGRRIPVLTAICAVWIVMTPLGAQDVCAEGVAWRTGSLEGALTAAKSKKTVVVVDVYATWCGPCKKYDREVFVRADVVEALSGAVPLKVDGEAGEGPELVKRYHVVGYPTILFLRPDGKEIDRIFGYKDGPEFIKWTHELMSGEKTVASLRKELAANPANNELRFEVGRRLTIRGELDEALHVFAPLFDGDKKNALGFVPKIQLLVGKYGYLRGREDYPKAIDLLTSLLTQFPESAEARSAPYPLARAYFKAGKPERAWETFDAWIDAKPDEAGRYNAAAWFSFKNKFDLERGLATGERGLKVAPEAAYLWDTVAEIQYALGKKAAARKSIEKAMSIAPEDPYYKEQLAKFSK